MSDFELLIATRNPGKQRELEHLLAHLPVRIRTLLEFPMTREVEETGSTFEENAILKASAYAVSTGLWTLADDSGLEVDALGGAPGVFSARYAGVGATDLQRVKRVMTELAATEDEERRARFVCAASISNPQGKIINTERGVCEGRIASLARGANGFGYDPVFVPLGHSKTFAELEDRLKATISHRARAMEAVNRFMIKFLSSAP